MNSVFAEDGSRLLRNKVHGCNLIKSRNSEWACSHMLVKFIKICCWSVQQKGWGTSKQWVKHFPEVPGKKAKVFFPLIGWQSILYLFLLWCCAPLWCLSTLSGRPWALSSALCPEIKGIKMYCWHISQPSEQSLRYCNDGWMDWLKYSLLQSHFVPPWPHCFRSPLYLPLPYDIFQLQCTSSIIKVF